MKTAVISLLVGIAIGWNVSAWRANGKIETIRADHAAALAKASEAARKQEAELLSKNEMLQGELRNEKTKYKKLAAARDADIDAGRLRFTVPVRGSDECAATESGQERAELEPSFAKSVFAIVDDGDAAIRELNYCIDAYESVRQQTGATFHGANIDIR